MIKRYSQVKEKRKARVRAKTKGTLTRPRLSVFRSNRYIYAQIIDDKKGETLVTASEFDLRSDKKRGSQRTQRRTEEIENKDSAPPVIKKASKTEKARLVGKILAKRTLKAGINKVVFDRGCYQYHGRVKALAEGAREGGLKF